MKNVAHVANACSKGDVCALCAQFDDIDISSCKMSSEVSAVKKVTEIRKLGDIDESVL